MEKMLFLSIRPVFVELILSGKKTVELRRQQPRCKPGDWVAIYSTTPERLLRGIAEVQEVRVTIASQLWKSVRGNVRISRSEYESYFTGSKLAVGIVLANPLPLLPVPLVTLREKWPGFQPPQSYRYLNADQSKFVVSRLTSPQYSVRR